MTVRVVGIGNPWAADDGVGAAVIDLLRRRLSLETEATRSQLELLTLTQPGLELLDAMDGCEQLIVVDAVATGAPPGTLHCIEWRPGVITERGVERASSHGLGLREMLDLAAVLGKLPRWVMVWGVEMASDAAGQGLSPEVAAALPGIVEELMRQVGAVG